MAIKIGCKPGFMFESFAGFNYLSDLELRVYHHDTSHVVLWPEF